MILSDSRKEVRRRSDMENSEFIKDDELTTYINQSYAELYDLLVSRFEEYYIQTESFTLAGGVASHPVPSNFYKIRGLDFQINSPDDWISLRKFNFAERNARNRNSNRVLIGVHQLSYRLMGNNLLIYPTNKADGNYRMWYVPRFVPLVLDSDSMSNVLDFEEYVIVDSAIKCLVKEESDPQALMMQKEAIRQRILNMAANRDVESPERVADMSQQSNGLESIFPRF